MLKKGIFPIVLTLGALGLQSCSGGDTAMSGQSETAVSTQAPDQTAPVPYNTSNTIRDIMDTLIDPRADELWNSVAVVSDADGLHEYYPETEEEWAALRLSAISIIEGANSLMMPGRHVAPPGATSEFPEYEFTPDEVDAKLKEDRQSWVGFAQNLQNAAMEMLDAVNTQDVDKLTEWGAYLDEACESCHQVFWYRTGI